MINRSILSLGLFSHLKHVLRIRVRQFFGHQFHVRLLHVLKICLHLSFIFMSVIFSAPIEEVLCTLTLRLLHTLPRIRCVGWKVGFRIQWRN